MKIRVTAKSITSLGLMLLLTAACSDSLEGTSSSILPDASTSLPDASNVTTDASLDADEGDAETGADEDANGDDADVEAPFDDPERELNDESALAGPRAHFNPKLTTVPEGGSATPAEFLAFPFPADHRRNADGTVRFDDFPRPSSLAQTLGNKLLDRYLAPVGGVDGFSLNGAIHIAFDREVDITAISQEPSDFLKEDAPFKLIDIDPTSPERGALRPLRWAYQKTEGSYVAPHSFAMAPAWGFPLRESTTYALVMTKSKIKDASNANPLRQPLLLSALLANRSTKPAALTNVTDALYESLRAAYKPLRAALHDKKIDISDVAVATVFTTQNMTKNLRRISSHLETDLKNGTWVPQATWKNTTWTKRGTSTSSSQTTYFFYNDTTFNGRNYQQGELPYLFEGGNFKFNVSNTPVGFKEETLTLVVTIPETPMATSDGCLPIVEIAHGTGGDAASGRSDGTAARLAARGIASVGMDQPLHGDRFDIANYKIPTDGILGTLLSVAGIQVIDENTLLSLLNFNFLNVDAARTAIRQSAVDTMALTHLIQRGGLDVPAGFSPTGEPIHFCKDKIGFFGHSQGALSGAIAAGIEHRVGAWLLSAGGGGLGITILDRKDFGDFPTILGLLFGLKTSSGELLTELHVLMSVIQTVVDVTDPINYAPFWMRDEKLGLPTSQLLTSGLNDSMTPARSARALATSAHLNPMLPLVLDMPEFDWAGVPALTAPMSGNNPSSTNAFIQWDSKDNPGLSDERWSGHFLVYYRPEAINATMRFLETYFAPESSDGLPIIEREVGADVKSSPAIKDFPYVAAPMPLHGLP